MSRIEWTVPRFEDEKAEYFRNSRTRAFLKRRGFVFASEKELFNFLATGSATAVGMADTSSAMNFGLLTEETKKSYSQSYFTGFERLLEAVQEHQCIALPMPILLLGSNRGFYVFSGNRRLNICLRLGTETKAWVVPVAYTRRGSGV